MKNVRVKEVVRYGGHSISANGAVNLTLKAMYSELANSVKSLQMLNNDILIRARIPGSKPMRLGMFRLKSVGIDGDGESTIKFNGLSDFIEVDNLNTLPNNQDDNKEFVVMLEAEIEEEVDDEEQ